MLSLPVDGFVDVARCVTAAVASDLDLGFEAVDDVELAVELVLRAGVVTSGSATITLEVDEERLTVAIGSPDGGIAEERLRTVVGDGIALGEALGRLVDEVKVVSEPAPALLLCKAFSFTIA